MCKTIWTFPDDGSFDQLVGVECCGCGCGLELMRGDPVHECPTPLVFDDEPSKD